MSQFLKIRFVRGSAWDSRLIEWQTRSWTSHVEFLNEQGTETFGAQLRGGVIWRRVNELCYRNVVKAHTWDLPISVWQDAVLRDFIHETTGLPYDWRAIVSFAFGERDWREPDSWFCSEWVAKLLERMEVLTFPGTLPTDRITPRDIWMLFTTLPGCRFANRQG